MKNPPSTLFIESLVQNRRQPQAVSAIQLWLKKQHKKPSALIQACDWYRRLGDFKRAYRVIAPKKLVIYSNSNQNDLRQHLWTARILNLMGAPHYALKICESLPELNSSEDLRVLGNIYLSNFNSARALPLFLKAEKCDPSPETYAARLGRIATCDALSGMGDHEEAFRRLKKISAKKDESLLQGILFQVEGEYHARMGNKTPAIKALNQGLPYFSKSDRSFDHGFIMKWLGVAHAEIKGKKNEASQFFQQAIQILKKPENRPEVWLDCIYWMKKVGMESKDDSLLYSYPGLMPGFTERYVCPHTFTLLSQNESLWISNFRKEHRTGKIHQAYLPKELELLGYIVASQGQGLPLNRAATLLWPDDMGSYLFLENRIQQLAKRLRQHYQLKVSIEKENLYLTQEDANQISVEVLNHEPRPSIFDLQEKTTLREVQNFYHLKRTQTHTLCTHWVNQGWITKVQNGRERQLIPNRMNRISFK